ncbi:apolipoprotein D-like [Brienomyrus brachyistius]|uniref:apolipoprotein D-like n=1 Tax=Brienomyrus brachyistius TaxID=42636 RepID=UPI0020B3D3EE|nr:apolipoprotein D-like [Brienomyrus brachyistius]
MADCCIAACIRPGQTNKSHQLRRRYDPAPSQSAQASDKIEASGGTNQAVGNSRDPSCTEHRRSPSVRMKARFIILLPLLLPLAGGQVYHWGPCPQLGVQPNFNLQMYLGKWYEIEKLPISFERGKCMETNYSMRGDNTIKVVNTEQLGGKLRSVEGTAVVLDVSEPAKLGVSFSVFTPYISYWILSTDYETSAAVYSCFDVLRIFHVDYAWILGRTRSLPEKTISAVKDIFIRSHIDMERMKPTDQEGCELPPV